MPISKWFVLNLGPVSRTSRGQTRTVTVYRIVSGGTTVDIGNATDPTGFIRALLDNKVVEYLVTQGVTGLSQQWAERQAQRVQSLLASTDHFVLRDQTLYTAPRGKTLADALKDPTLGSYVVTENRGERTGPSLSDVLLRSLDTPEGQKVPVDNLMPNSVNTPEAETVSIGNDPLLDSLRDQPQEPAIVVPQVLESGQGGQVSPGTIDDPNGGDPVLE